MSDIKAYKEVSDQSSLMLSLKHVQDYISSFSAILQNLDYLIISQIIQLFSKAREEDRMIFFVGNGGSASTASHFASDLSTGMNLKPLRAISLTDNNSILTALANDFSYQDVFVKQLEALYRKDDLLVAISASGNSPNILRAVEYVKRLQGITIGLTGFNGGKLLTASDYCIIVPTDQGEYGFVEDAHLIINHIVATYFRRYS